jgi:hypothetical protein
LISKAVGTLTFELLDVRTMLCGVWGALVRVTAQVTVDLAGTEAGVHTIDFTTGVGLKVRIVLAVPLAVAVRIALLPVAADPTEAVKVAEFAPAGI